jgi:Zn-dependent metalloprotease
MKLMKKAYSSIISILFITMMGLSIMALLSATGFSQNMLGKKLKKRPHGKFSSLSDSLRKTRKKPNLDQHNAFHKFNKKHLNSWRVRYSPRTALPEAIVGGKTLHYSGNSKSIAKQFIDENSEMLKIDFSKLKFSYSKKSMGIDHLVYKEVYNGLPVEFSYVKLHIKDNGEVIGYQARYEPVIHVSPLPKINVIFARGIISADYGSRPRGSAKLVYYPDEEDGSVKLVWKIKARGSKTNPGSWIYYIDAENGDILFKYDDLRYVCPGTSNTTVGTVNAMVYETSPEPYEDPPVAPFLEPVLKPLTNQYVWVADYSSRAVASNGEYCFGKSGKVFATLKGPYFSVVDFRGASAYFENGGGTWVTRTESAEASDHPYDNSRTYTYNSTIGAIPTGFAFTMPRFTNFSVGELDIWSDVLDGDMLHIHNSDNEEIAAYIGQRDNSFFGAPIESPTYSLVLKTDESGTYNGFIVDISSSLVLSDNPGVTSNGTGSILWSTATTPNTTNDQVNAFYHLNKAHDYFEHINREKDDANTKVIDIDQHLPVMVHAHGQSDRVESLGGMLNAYYDMENNNIFLGEGPLDGEGGTLRSFALDGTIVRHEYIHYVMGRIYPIINFGEFGAISEAMADYFAIASFKKDGNPITKLGNFIGAGEAATRDVVGTNKMPDDWFGEVHDDSLILSQALWDLRDGAYDLGTVSGGTFDGAHRADLFTFASLFYFPDNFANFYDAMLMVCEQLDATCDSAMKTKITNAFSDHGIAGSQAGGDQYENNNGPESATDISTFTTTAAGIKTLSANVFPLGDVDYYSVPLSVGNLTVKLDLPETSQDGIYFAYAIFLFDAYRNYIVDTYPTIYNGYNEWTCQDSGDCKTLSDSVTLNHAITEAGRYYLVVAGAPNQYYGNSPTNSSSLYTLNLEYSPLASAQATLFSASFDNDRISFEVPYTLFNMESHPSSATLTSAETVFSYARLLDHNKEPLTETRTDISSSYMELQSGSLGTRVDFLNRNLMTGNVKITTGFESRYPSIGTVYLEVFGVNHIGQIVSLGVSGALHLTSNKADVVTYNNIISAGAGTAIIKYDLLTGGQLTIKIYTSNGTLIKTLIDTNCPAGKGTLEWNGKNLSGQNIASGIYYVKVKGPGINKIDKIAVVN